MRGRAPNGSAASNSRKPTAPASGKARSTANTTCAATHGPNSAFKIESNRLSLLVFRFHEGHTRRIAHRHVFARKIEAAGRTIDPENRHVVAALIAAIQEGAGRVEGETARVVAARPLVGEPLQTTVSGDGEDADAVVQAVADIEELAVGRDQDSRTEVAAGEAGGQRRDRLPRRQFAGRRVVIEPNHRRTFLLNGVKPAAIGVEVEVPWAVAGRQRREGRIVRRKRSIPRIELPDVN